MDGRHIKANKSLCVGPLRHGQPLMLGQRHPTLTRSQPQRLGAINCCNEREMKGNIVKCGRVALVSGAEMIMQRAEGKQHVLSGGIQRLAGDGATTRQKVLCYKQNNYEKINKWFKNISKKKIV